MIIGSSKTFAPKCGGELQTALTCLLPPEFGFALVVIGFQMASTVEPNRPPITESAWFWLYLFATFGLALLVIMSPKFNSRQAQIERQAQGRSRAIQSQMGHQPSTEMSTADNTIVTLRPLFWILGIALVIGWTTLWWNRFRGQSIQPANEKGTIP